MQMWGERSQITPSPALRPEQTLDRSLVHPRTHNETQGKVSIFGTFQHHRPPRGLIWGKTKGGRGSLYPRGKKSVIVDTRWKHTISEQTLVVGVCGEVSSILLTVNLSCLSHPFDQPREHILQSGLGFLCNFKELNMSQFGSFSLGLITEVFAQLHLFRNKWQLSLLKQSRANK